MKRLDRSLYLSTNKEKDRGKGIQQEGLLEASRMQDEAEKDDAKKRKGNYPRSTQ